MHVFVHVYAQTFVYTCVYVHEYEHVCAHLCIYVMHMQVCLCVYMHDAHEVCMFKCTVTCANIQEGQERILDVTLLISEATSLHHHTQLFGYRLCDLNPDFHILREILC